MQTCYRVVPDHSVLKHMEIKTQKIRQNTHEDNQNIKEDDNMGEVIVITSGKGGVGKTTTTANIGRTF